mmetsp:Transcript_69394/g.193111  ORF Transcript_69394/g.193111 Transcript_69394/m.193111 type:complete len:252 (-) Transcript_69394:170-925(-)
MLFGGGSDFVQFFLGFHAPVDDLFNCRFELRRRRSAQMWLEDGRRSHQNLARALHGLLHRFHSIHGQFFASLGWYRLHHLGNLHLSVRHLFLLLLVHLFCPDQPLCERPHLLQLFDIPGGRNKAIVDVLQSHSYFAAAKVGLTLFRHQDLLELRASCQGVSLRGFAPFDGLLDFFDGQLLQLLRSEAQRCIRERFALILGKFRRLHSVGKQRFRFPFNRFLVEFGELLLQLLGTRHERGELVRKGAALFLG